MAKQAVAVRLDPEMLEWADGYAKRRGVSRQVVLEAAVAEFREACEGGVPELEAPAVPQRPPVRERPAKVKPRRVPPRAPAPTMFYADALAARQARLNADKDRAS